MGNRYASARGFRPTFLTLAASDESEAWSDVISVMGGAEPSFTSRSIDTPRWSGPVSYSLFWDSTPLACLSTQNVGGVGSGPTKSGG
jgi:hypothetical protein